jgi:SAM-dependent methyltransferase
MTDNKGNQFRIRVGEIQWGDLKCQEPVSDYWGFDRGQPIDRYFIENFLQKHASDVHGYCLEVMNDDYIRKFGGDRVTASEVLDINANNPKATIVGDLTDPATLSPNTFDCFIMTQTLPVIYDGNAVIKNSYRALKPGGILLITAPAMCRYSPHPLDYWRFTDKSLERLIVENTDAREFEIEKHGNLVCSIGFLIGAASQELKPAELDYNDPRFPIVISARLAKPPLA